MIRTLVAAFVFLLSGLSAFAQGVPIRSGEHTGFTRLALDLPERIGWTRENGEGRVSIIFADRTLLFDTGRVFERSTRDRLADLSTVGSGGRLDLRLACDCRVDLFWHARAMLVIDIHDRPVTRHSRTDSAAQREDAGSLAGLPSLSPSAAMAAEALSSGVARAAAVSHHRQEASAAPLRITQRALLEQLARAASLGVLEAAKPEDSASAEQVPTDLPETGELPKEEHARAQDHATAGALAHMGVRTRSLEARPGEGDDNAIVQTAAAQCVPVEIVDVPSWGGSMPFHLQVGELNRKLMQEFDRPDPDTVLALARLYIHYGFGLESGQVTRLGDIPPNRTIEVLREMAEIVDRLQGPPDGRLARDLDCNGPSALWAVLSHETLPKDRPLDHSEILKAFRALPEHLREHFGPVLSRRLGAAGHIRTADMVLRAMGYPEPSMPSERGLAIAELAFAEGHADRAETALQSVIDQNSESAAEAVLALIERRLEDDRHVPHDTAKLAGAFHQQYRGTEMEPRLAEVYLVALAASGDFQEAFSEYRRLSPGMSAQSAGRSQNAMLGLLVRHAKDVSFLRHVLNDEGRAFGALPDDLALDISERLLALGFADQAAGAAPPAENTRSKLVRAGVALANGDPAGASDALQDVTGPEADRLRARASSMVGDHAAAARYYRAARDDAAADKAAWMARDWPQTGQADNDVLQRLARMSAERPPLEPGSLTQKRDLLKQSTELRSVLDEFIASQGL